VTEAAVSPACNFKFMAKRTTRVRRSELNWTEEVSGKGSRFCVTDSKATARVEVGWLTSTGRALCAAAFRTRAGPPDSSSARMKQAASGRAQVLRR
jgi:hypothetical protein